MKLSLIKSKSLKNRTCFIKIFILTSVIYAIPTFLHDDTSYLSQTNNRSPYLDKDQYNISSIDVKLLASLALLESESVYAQRKTKKKSKNYSSDEGKEMMANNKYSYLKERT